MATAPCEWPIVESDACDALEDLDPEVADAVERAAIEHLWTWTRRAYGTCEVKIRPCRRDCAGSTFYSPVRSTFVPGSNSTGFLPALIGGQWFNIECGRCGSSCSCSSLSEVRLPGPVASIDEVRIDGEVLDDAAYRVDDFVRLVRTDGGRWPVCQDMAAPPTESGTFEVTYRRGTPVPAAGQIAAGLLACEMAKALTGDKKCQLSGRVEQVTREGVNMVLINDEPREGLTGIFLVDSFIQTAQAPRKMRVVNPDTWLRQRRRTS